MSSYYSDGVEVVEGSRFGGESSGPIFLDQLHCTGDEESLSECTEPGMHMCTHQHDVGVICQCKMMYIVHEIVIVASESLTPISRQ